MQSKTVYSRIFLPILKYHSILLLILKTIGSSWRAACLTSYLLSSCYRIDILYSMYFIYVH